MNSKRGAVLIMTFIIMTTLTAITTAFLFMTSIQTKGAGYDIASHKALWLAEAGLQQVMYQLKNDADYRSNPTTVNGNLSSGSYSVTVSKDGSTYTLTSTGTVDVLNRKVQEGVSVTVGFPSAFNYVLFGNTNSSALDIKDDVVISGDVYYDGEVEVEEDASITNGLVYADSVSGDGTYTVAPGPPSPVPTYPAFGTTWYDNLITTAETQASSDWTLSSSSTYDLNGGTVYYQEITIKDNATITGPGTIVATKDMTIKDNANISSNVAIITKKELAVQNNAVIQSSAVLYGRDGIELKNNANVTGSLIVATSNKKVEMKDDAVLTGIIYGDKVELKDDAAISGTVVADEFEGNKIEGGVTITYNQASLPGSLPNGLEIGEVTVTPQKDWNEIPLS